MTDFKSTTPDREKLFCTEKNERLKRLSKPANDGKQYKLNVYKRFVSTIVRHFELGDRTRNNAENTYHT